MAVRGRIGRTGETRFSMIGRRGFTGRIIGGIWIWLMVMRREMIMGDEGAMMIEIGSGIIDETVSRGDFDVGHEFMNWVLGELRSQRAD